MPTKKTANETLEVEIFGTTYTLRGGADPSAVRALALDLDSRMRDLADAAPAADPLKVAVLAALRLADEAREAEETAELRREEVAARIDQMTTRLDRIMMDGSKTEEP